MSTATYNDKHVVICLQCGDLYCTDQDTTCRFCNGELYHTAINQGIYISKDNKFREDLLNTYVYNPENTKFNPLYAKARREEHFQKIERQNQINQQKQAAKRRSANACPKCGRDAGFTPVRRKWSLLTGFATNKVDMVCNHCGYVKK